MFCWLNVLNVGTGGKFSAGADRQQIKGRRGAVMGNAGEIYIDDQHKEFYSQYIQKCGCKDSHHKALLYCLGIDGTTRKHIQDIYDFDTGSIKTGCLHEGWQTSSSKKVIRLAFNLYTDRTVSVYDYDNQNDRLEECGRYNVAEIMCCGYVKYFLEAVKIRYAGYL